MSSSSFLLCCSSAAVVLLAAAPAPAAAQAPPARAWTREVSVAIGLGHVFRYDDQTFGDRPAPSAGMAIVHRSGLAIELDLSRPLGLRPAPSPCGVVIDGRPAICDGTAHDGVRSAPVAALGVRYQFGRGRVRPYLTAGLGMIRSHTVWSTATVAGDRVLLSERTQHDTGFGPDVGAGVRLDLSPRLSLRPEVRWLEASVASPLSLSVARVSARLAYIF